MNSNPIVINFMASESNGGGFYQESFGIFSFEDIEKCLKEFDDNCPFRKYEMETHVSHANGDDLSDEEREWFLKVDEKENIGFAG